MFKETILKNKHLKFILSIIQSIFTEESSCLLLIKTKLYYGYFWLKR